MLERTWRVQSLGKIHYTKQHFIILHGRKESLALCALAALSYLNLYSLLSSLCIISRLTQIFPPHFDIMEYHSI